MSSKWRKRSRADGRSVKEKASASSGAEMLTPEEIESLRNEFKETTRNARKLIAERRRLKLPPFDR